MNSVQMRRLRLLAKRLKRLTPAERKHFNMHAWMVHERDVGSVHEHPVTHKLVRSGQRLRNSSVGYSAGVIKPTRQDLVHCGTSACALGWAASMPLFQRLGLRMDWSTESELGEVKLVQPGKRSKIGFAAAAQLFGMTLHTATWVFTSYFSAAKNTVEAVIGRMNIAIEHRGKVKAHDQYD